MAEVKLTLGGETFVLKCTLDAFRTIPATLGGFVGAFTAMQTADVNTCAFIIAAATGKANDFKEQTRIVGLMFEDGFSPEIITRIAEYVVLLKNGGKAEVPNGSAGE